MADTAAKKKPAVNWGAMESDWRAGIKPVLQLSKEYNVSRAAILKHWEKVGILRDLTAKIKAQAAALVTQDALKLVAHEVTQERLKATEVAVVEANAQLQANIQLKHRADVGKARTLVMQLFDELAVQSSNEDLLDQLAEAVAEDSPKRLETFNRVTSLSGRAATLDKLATSLKTLIGLEREAFGLDAVGAGDADPVEKLGREELEAAFRAMMDRAKVIPGESERVLP